MTCFAINNVNFNKNILSPYGKMVFLGMASIWCTRNHEFYPSGMITKFPISNFTGFLDSVEAQLVPSDASLLMLQKDIPKRLVLVNRRSKIKRPNRLNTRQLSHVSKAAEFSPKLRSCGKSKSLDSSDIFHSNDFSMNLIATKKNLRNTPEKENETKLDNQNAIMDVIEENPVINNKNAKPSRNDLFSSPLMRRRKQDDEKVRGRSNLKKSGTVKQSEPDNARNVVGIHTQALANLEKLISKLKEDDTKSSKSEAARLPRSQPSSPAPSKKGKLIW